MWPSGVEDNQGGLSCTSSGSSSSTSSSPSPFSPSAAKATLHHNPRSAQSMEEVWKDINLAALHDNSPRDDPHAINLRGTILQDFLARPFSKDSTASLPSRYGSPAPPPATMLTLSSGSDFHFLGNSDPLRPSSLIQPQPMSSASCLSMPFEPFASTGSHANGKKRFLDSEDKSGDRRHKRMIKNRESAARSRARKQAYTNELELEVAHLMEENARLRKEQQQLCLAAAAQVPKKRTLHRTSTAPF